MDMVALIASNLPLQALGRLGCINIAFDAAVKTSVNHAWEVLCNTIWDGKVSIPATAIQARDARDSRLALKLSLEDAHRTQLSDEELTTLQWNFRFKLAMGESWTEMDPYWNHRQPTQVYFDANGAIHAKGFEMLESRNMKWCWKQATDGTTSLDRSCIEPSIDGRIVPTYHISRHAPTWGWLIQSCWVLYTSFPMPPPGTDPTLDDEALPVTVERQSQEESQSVQQPCCILKL